MYEKIRVLSEKGYKLVLAKITVDPVSNPVVSFGYSVTGGKDISISTQIWHFKISATSHAVEQLFSKFLKCHENRTRYQLFCIFPPHIYTYPRTALT
jgi:hypothetical protein